MHTTAAITEEEEQIITPVDGEDEKKAVISKSLFPSFASMTTEQYEYLIENKESLFAPYYQKGAISVEMNIELFIHAVVQWELNKAFPEASYRISLHDFIHQEMTDLMEWWQASTREKVPSMIDNVRLEGELCLLTSAYLKLPKDHLPPRKEFLQNVQEELTSFRIHMKNPDVFPSELHDISYYEEFEVMPKRTDKGWFVSIHDVFSGNVLSLESTLERPSILSYIEEMKKESPAFDFIEDCRSRWKNFLQKLPVHYRGDQPYESLRQVAKHALFGEEYAAGVKAAKLQKEFEHALSTCSPVLLATSKDTAKWDGRSWTVNNVQYVMDEPKTITHSMHQRTQAIGEKVQELFEQTGFKAEALVRFFHDESNLFEILIATQRFQPSQRRSWNLTRNRTTHRLRWTAEGWQRETGEAIWTDDVLVYEITQYLAALQSERRAFQKKAKNMFYSCLTASEVDDFSHHQLVVLEGKNHDYVLQPRLMNPLTRFPKGEASLEAGCSLCIHPSSNHIPLYDSLATLVLAIRSGDESYIEHNSNKFRLGDHFESVVSFYQSHLERKTTSHA